MFSSDRRNINNHASFGEGHQPSLREQLRGGLDDRPGDDNIGLLQPRGNNHDSKDTNLYK